MKPFKHYTARSVGEATRLLAAYAGKARANAGGTDLLAAMRDKCMAAYPEAVIDIKTIDGLDYIKDEGPGLRIGALTRLSDIAASPAVKGGYGLLAQAAYSVATPHVRNMATLGGNLAQDVRCWYYRYPSQIGGPIVCLRKGGKVCSALAGDNRYHSLFGAARPGQYPCSGGCPARTDIPAYLGKAAAGDLAAAARTLMAYNPLPAITGRVCPVLCEPECGRGAFDDPVAIHCVERALGDYVLGRPREFYGPPAKASGRNVAVVGSGPAGLAAAFYLRQAGHGVTVYERLPEAGGMLLYSIPSYRLPKDVVRRQVRALQDMGIAFRVGVDVGSYGAASGLKEGFDAVFFAGGAWKSLKLGVAGEDAPGVRYALDYLKEINAGGKVPLGGRVVVIGGGSVAVDAARTAKRTGAGEVHLVCLECLDPASKDRMLARQDEIEEAVEEGVIVHPSLGIKEILTEDAKAAGVATMTCTSVREPDGAFNPVYDLTCVSAEIAADSVIVAIGQTVDGPPAAFGIPGGAIDPAAGLVSSVEGGTPVFAGGDAVSGPSTVIEAVASGREAARRIDEALTGAKNAGAARPEGAFGEPSLAMTPRARVRGLSVSERLKGIEAEDAGGISVDEIAPEAGRCFNCGCLAVGPSDVGIALVALDARIVTTKRTIGAARFFAASAEASHVLDADELIKEVRVPRPPEGSRQRYEKFTLRKPVDFAIASVASVLTVRDGVCADARIILGGVAPAPLRAKAAERLVKGAALDEKTAVRAAEQAVEGARPLAMNAYKVAITKALVRRVLLE